VSLGPQVRQHGPDQVDRAEQVSLDHPSELLVAGLLDGAEQAVAGVTDDHVDRAERPERARHDPAHLLGVGDVEQGRPVRRPG
jgi:hypothetical protein